MRFFHSFLFLLNAIFLIITILTHGPIALLVFNVLTLVFIIVNAICDAIHELVPKKEKPWTLDGK